MLRHAWAIAALVAFSLLLTRRAGRAGPDAPRRPRRPRRSQGRPQPRSSRRRPRGRSTATARPAASSSTAPGSTAPIRRSTATARAGSAIRRPAAGCSRRSPTPGTPPMRARRRSPARVGWYRKDFRLPSTAKRLMWTARFESVNYKVTIWLNGRFLGTHKGAYLPFELRLPRGFLKRTGVNHLVLRVDSRRTASDFPPAKFDARGRPLGGWWNYGGILREVYLRAIDDIDFDVVDVRPDLPCATCAATINWTVRVRNAGTESRRFTVFGNFGARRVKLGTVALRPKTSVTLTRRLRVPKPRLWSPDRPVPLRRDAAGDLRQAHPADLHAQRRRALDQGLGRATRAERPPAERARRRHPGGLAHEGLRDRQRHARSAARLGPRPRRDDDPRPLPAASLHARAGRPPRHPGLVGGAGLPGGDARNSRRLRCATPRSACSSRASSPTATTRR